MLHRTDNPYAEFWIERDILFFVYKKGVTLNLDAARQIVADRLELQRGKAYPVLCDPSGIKDSDKAARDYLAREGSQLVKAVGLIVETPLARMMLNFYQAINKPLVPTRLFGNKDKALLYLESFVEESALIKDETSDGYEME
jgi:hypothetical protein